MTDRETKRRNYMMLRLRRLKEDGATTLDTNDSQIFYALEEARKVLQEDRARLGGKERYFADCDAALAQWALELASQDTKTAVPGLRSSTADSKVGTEPKTTCASTQHALGEPDPSNHSDDPSVVGFTFERDSDGTFRQTGLLYQPPQAEDIHFGELPASDEFKSQVIDEVHSDVGRSTPPLQAPYHTDAGAPLDISPEEVKQIFGNGEYVRITPKSVGVDAFERAKEFLLQHNMLGNLDDGPGLTPTAPGIRFLSGWLTLEEAEAEQDIWDREVQPQLSEVVGEVAVEWM
jgi:hypothetical protein